MSKEVKTTKKSKAASPAKSAAVVKLQLVKSGAGRSKKQIGTLKGLGLNRLNAVSELSATPEVLGMVSKVKHLVKVLG